MSDQYIFTASEAAEFLRNKPSTLAVWRSQARGPVYVKGRGGIRYRRHDLEQWAIGGIVVQRRIEETSPCHILQRSKTKRLRGRAAVAQRERRLAAEPYCRDCRDNGVTRLADELDHITPLVDGGADSDENVRSLCGPCHTARTRDRFGKQ